MAKRVPLPTQPPGVPFPTDEWPEGEGAIPVDRERVCAIAEIPFDDVERFGETHALLVVHRGRLVFERYGDGYGPNEIYRSWSMAKSIAHAWVGLLVRDGRLHLEGPAPVPHWGPGDPRHDITLEQMLRMVDGLDFIEEYVPDVGSHVIAMLFQEGKDDVAGFAQARPLAHEPGTHWNYSSGTSNIVSALAGRAVGGGVDEIRAYLRRELFDPIGMSTAEPRFDAAGTFIASSYVFASARDFARFGLLYLRDGVWDARRILPEGWVDHARTTTPASGGEYGAHWWLRIAGEDSFYCSGFQGQYIVCIPSRDLVIVRLGVSSPEQREPIRAWFSDLAAPFA
ncbi:MAG: serine hydrolase [bacterium]|nr:serine hydrolase [bacterium]